MDTVGTGRASQFRLSERQFGWRLPCPRRGRRPSISGTRFIGSNLQSESMANRQLVQLLLHARGRQAG